MRASPNKPAIRSTTPTQTLRAREHNAKNRRERRQQELEERLQTLENRANAAKVSLGLARISKAGYLQYIKEMERERALIEGELMTINQAG